MTPTTCPDIVVSTNYWLGEVRVFLSLAVGEGAYIRNHMVGFTHLLNYSLRNNASQSLFLYFQPIQGTYYFAQALLGHMGVYLGGFGAVMAQ